MSVNYDLIKKRRKQLNLTGEKLGKLIGVSKQTISKYENGTVGINNTTLKKLSDVLDIDLNEFYGRKCSYIKNNIYPNDDNEQWSDDEIVQIEQFKEFIKSKRPK